MSGEPLLSVRDLSVDFSTYGRRSQVLRDVSLDVPARIATSRWSANPAAARA